MDAGVIQIPLRNILKASDRLKYRTQERMLKNNFVHRSYETNKTTKQRKINV